MENTMKKRNGIVESILHAICVVFIYLLSKNIAFTLVMMFILSLFFHCYGFTRRLKVLLTTIFVIIAIIFMLFACCNKPKVEPPKDNDQTAQVEDQKQPEDQQVIQTGGGYKKPDRGYGVTDTVKPTYGNVNGDKTGKQDANKGNTEVVGPKEQTFKSPDVSKQEEELNQKIQDAKDKGDTVTEGEDGIVFVGGSEEDSKPDESKPSPEGEKPKGNVVTDKDKEQDLFDEVFPEEKNHNNDVVPTPDSNIKDLEKPSASDSTNSNSGVSSEETPNVDQTTPSDKQNTSDNDKNTGNVPQDVVTQPSETKPSQEDKAEKKETPVSITSISGARAFAGDSVQFKVEGDVASIEGLDGLDYDFSGGYLTVYTNPSEATVITPIVIGADGIHTAKTSVTISVDLSDFVS